jgi:hypothetical protein
MLISLVMAESPIPSEPESPFDFREPNLEVFTETLIQPEVRDSDFRDECARRDGYRCCVTGHLDTKNGSRMDICQLMSSTTSWSAPISYPAATHPGREVRYFS